MKKLLLLFVMSSSFCLSNDLLPQETLVQELDEALERLAVLKQFAAAFQSGSITKKHCQQLISKPGDQALLFDRMNEEGLTLFHLIVLRGTFEAVVWCVEQAPEIVNTEDNDGRTPLHWAVLDGNKDVIFYLLSQNALKDKQDNQGRTPKDYAQVIVDQLSKVIDDPNNKFLNLLSNELLAKYNELKDMLVICQEILEILSQEQEVEHR